MTGRRRRTVRFRITATAVAIAAVVLAIAAVIVVVVVQRELRENLDRSLAQRADQIVSVVGTEPPTSLGSLDHEDRFAQIVDGSGEVIAATDNVAGEPPLVDRPTSDEEVVVTRSDLPIEDDRYRVLVHRFGAADSDGVRYVIVGENVDDVTDGVRALMATLAIVFPVAVAVLAAVVWWLVGRTLRPVEDIRSQVSTIGLDELDHRVPAPGTGDEIDRLAATMNEMLARLEQASEVQRRFVADASHELRTPLTRLRTSLEVDLAAREGHGPGDVDLEATCRAALDDAIDMQVLIDDLLFLARRDAGHVDVASDRLDLDVIVDEEVGLARQDGTAGGVDDVEIDMSGVSAATVVGDRRQIARLVRNLVSNACRYAASSVVVSVVETGDGGVELSVADDGPGVPHDDRERIFDRFVRLDASRSSREGGSGLGLAIVRDIADSHGATVEVDDAPIGGARFRVVFPGVG